MTVADQLVSGAAPVVPVPAAVSKAADRLDARRRLTSARTFEAEVSAVDDCRTGEGAARAAPSRRPEIRTRRREAAE